MTDLAFAVLYTVLGLPIARVAERGDRPLIIAAAVAVWSGFTALSGMAQTFTHLILARIGVGVGGRQGDRGARGGRPRLLPHLAPLRRAVGRADGEATSRT